MKKKIYLAVLASAAALAMAGCGTDAVKKEEPTAQEESKTEEKKEESKDGAVDESAADEMGEEADKGEEKSKTSADTSLVTVKDPEKYIKLGQYKGLEVDQVSILVSKEQIEAYMTDSMGGGQEMAGAVVEEGDTVVIDYVGTKDGEEFEGGSAENMDLLIGSGSFIEGFEEGLIGAKKGETRDLALTFPEDYDKAPELAGEDVNFQVTVQKILRPELTDDWVAKNTEYKTIEEYYDATADMLQEYADENARATMKLMAWEKLLIDSEVKEYPEEDLENAAEVQRRQASLYAEQGGMELEEFIESQGQTMEQFEEQLEQYAESKVKQNLIVQSIMNAEGLSLNDESSQAIQERMMKAYGIEDMAVLIDLYGQEQIDESIGVELVCDFILDNAVLVEPTETEAAGQETEQAAEE